MNKRTRKKWNSKKSVVNGLQVIGQCVNKSKDSENNVEFYGGERHGHDVSKKTSLNRSKYLCNRSKSVPTKTVSFWPYIVDHFSKAPTRVRAEGCRSDACCGNKVKAGPRRMLCRKKQAADSCCNHAQGQDPREPSEDNLAGNQHFHGDYRSPGPPKYHSDHLCCGGGFNSNRIPESPFDQSGLHLTKSPSRYNAYSSVLPYTRYHPANTILGSSYIKHIVRTRSQWPANDRPVHIPSGLKAWEADQKNNYLLAKYSEHNCPKSHPARADYFNFKKYVADDGQPVGNRSQNRSPSARFVSLSSSHSRSLSRPRTPEKLIYNPEIDVLRSRYGKWDNNYYMGASGAFYSSLQNPIHTFPQNGQYQSEAMRELMMDSLAKKYTRNSSNDESSQLYSTKSDFEMNTKLYRLSKDLYSSDLPYRFSGYRSFKSSGRTRYDSTDDRKLLIKPYSIPDCAPYQVGARSYPCKANFLQRSRSSDATFNASLAYDDYNDISKNSKYGSGLTKDTGKICDVRKSSTEKYDSYTKVLSRYDDVISSSKYGTSSNSIKKLRSNSGDSLSLNVSAVPRSNPMHSSSAYDRNWCSSKANEEASSSMDAQPTQLRKPMSFTKYDRFSYTGTRDTTNGSEQRATKDCESINEGCSWLDKRQDSLHGTRLNHDTTRGSVKEYTSLCNIKRNPSISPVFRRDFPNCSSGSYGSSKMDADFASKHNDTALKHCSSEPLGTMNSKSHKYPVEALCKIYSGNTPNLPQSSRPNKDSNFQGSNESTNYKPISSSQTRSNSTCEFGNTTNTLSDRIMTRGGHANMGVTSRERSQTPLLSNFSKQMLDSWMEEESDRLRKVEVAIDRHRDGTSKESSYFNKHLIPRASTVSQKGKEMATTLT